MNLRQFVSSRLTEELIKRILTVLPSISSDVGEDAMSNIIRTEVAKLQNFSFEGGSELRTLTDHFEKATKNAMKSDVSMADAYAIVRKDNDYAYDVISEMATVMAGHISSMIAMLRVEVPTACESMTSQIHQAIATGTEDAKSRYSASVFTWGRLNESRVASEAIMACQEHVNVFKSDEVKPFFIEAIGNRLATHVYEGVTVVADLATIQAALLEKVGEEHALAVDAILNRRTLARILGNLQMVFLQTTGYLHMHEVLSTLDKLSFGLEALHAVDLSEVVSAEAEQLISRRLNTTTTMSLLAYGAFEAIRRSNLSKSVVIPTAPTEGSVEWDQKSVLVNGDVLPSYIAALEAAEIGDPEQQALIDVANSFRYMSLHKTMYSRVGRDVAWFMSMRTVINDEVMADEERLRRDAEQDRVSVLSSALTKVLTSHATEVLQGYTPREAERMNVVSQRLLARAKIDASKNDRAMEDVVSAYVVGMKDNPQLTHLFNNLRSLMITYSGTLDDVSQIRSYSFCHAISEMVAQFIATTGNRSTVKAA